MHLILWIELTSILVISKPPCCLERTLLGLPVKQAQVLSVYINNQELTDTFSFLFMSI